MDQFTSTENLFELQVDPQVVAHLSDASKWGKFISIVGFVFCGIMVLVSIFAGAVLGRGLPGAEAATIVNGSVFTVIYLVLAALWFVPCLFLYKFSTHAQEAIRRNDQGSFAESFKNLKACFRFVGIVTIVMLSFYAVALVIGMAALAMM